MRLAQADLHAILRFLSEAEASGADDAYGPIVLDHLRRLIPCDDVGYQEADVEARRFTDSEAAAHEEEDARYWAAGPCPVTEYRIRTGDVTAIRMSDLVAQRRFHELPVYRDYFRPLGIDHMLDLGLSPIARSYRSLILFRETGAPDFSERERRFWSC